MNRGRPGGRREGDFRVQDRIVNFYGVARRRWRVGKGNFLAASVKTNGTRYLYIHIFLCRIGGTHTARNNPEQLSGKRKKGRETKKIAR